MYNNQRIAQVLSKVQEVAEQQTCHERENDKNYYVEFLPNGRENDNFYPPYPSDAFEDGVKCGRIDFARELMVILGGQP